MLRHKIKFWSANSMHEYCNSIQTGQCLSSYSANICVARLGHTSCVQLGNIVHSSTVLCRCRCAVCCYEGNWGRGVTKVTFERCANTVYVMYMKCMTAKQSLNRSTTVFIWGSNTCKRYCKRYNHVHACVLCVSLYMQYFTWSLHVWHSMWVSSYSVC